MLGELAISYDEGKLIGVLTGTGGISDMVEGILAACAKDTGARVLYDADPAALVVHDAGRRECGGRSAVGRRASLRLLLHCMCRPVRRVAAAVRSPDCLVIARTFGSEPHLRT
jgi:hypothetical protein